MTNELLVKQIQKGNTALMIDLYEQNRGFIFSVVKHNVIGADDYEDAMQDAYIGLHRAVQGFEENKGYKFLTYAKYYITLAVRRGQNNALYVPEYVRVLAHRIKHTQTKLAAELKRTPTSAEIARYMDLDVNTIKNIIATTKSVKSIYEPIMDDITVGDAITDKRVDFENDIANADERRYISETVRAAVNLLPTKERIAVECYYFEGMTYKQIGEKMGVSLDYVRQLINRALKYRLTKTRLKNMIDNEIDELTPFYQHIGFNTYNRTWTSSTENAVIEREHLREFSKVNKC